MLITKRSIISTAGILSIALIVITVFIMTPSTVISSPIRSNTLTFDKPTQWSDPSYDNLSFPTSPITTTREILPSHVFVIENRELATQLPLNTASQPESTSEESAPESGITQVSATILPSRQIVVNENDQIISVWSNTTGAEHTFYSMRVWSDRLNGAEHNLTPNILSQYNKLLVQLDWNRTGQVYCINSIL